MPGHTKVITLYKNKSLAPLPSPSTTLLGVGGGRIVRTVFRCSPPAAHVGYFGWGRKGRRRALRKEEGRKAAPAAPVLFLNRLALVLVWTGFSNVIDVT